MEMSSILNRTRTLNQSIECLPLLTRIRTISTILHLSIVKIQCIAILSATMIYQKNSSTKDRKRIMHKKNTLSYPPTTIHIHQLDGKLLLFFLPFYCLFVLNLKAFIILIMNSDFNENVNARSIFWLIFLHLVKF